MYYRKHILPEKAKEILLNNFITITRPISEEKCLAHLLFWSIMDLETLDSPDDLEVNGVYCILFNINC